jgi:hypothetical protein
MSFELQVDFSGLCLYVVDSAQGRVGVAMPDARGRTAGSTRHEDNTLGKRHVGYVRFDLANAGIAAPAGGGRAPHYEGIHLFDREELVFVINGDPTPLTANLAVPECEKIAPDGAASALAPVDNLFSGPIPPQLLMRTVLHGGEVTGTPVETWRFPSLWSPGQPAYEAEFASVVTWKRRVESVALQIRPLGGGTAVNIPLTPPQVNVKVANFCETNPLEWKDLGLRAVDGDDEDFKWLYRLLKPRDGRTWPQKLQLHRFPIPLMTVGGSQGVEDCLGAQIQGTVG